MVEVAITSLMSKEEDLPQYITVIDRTLQKRDNSGFQLSGSLTISQDHLHALISYT